jgi:threonine-phosphate decarboxylase
VQNAEIDIDKSTSGETIIQKTPSVHGDNIYADIVRYGLQIKDILDFSSNVNPFGPSSVAIRAAKRALAITDRFPDPDMLELRTGIARYFGVKPDNVFCGNGSIGIIHLIPHVFAPKKVLIPFPTFMEYTDAVQNAGSSVVPFPLLEHTGFRVDPLELSFALKDVDMAFLCNPNNPTGQLIPKADAIEIVEYARQHGVRLVVDEAFMDFVDSESIIKEAVASSHVICLRTFSQLFGMPGLRIGYAVSDETSIAELREGQQPWSVSLPAEQAAIAVLGHWSYINKTRRLIDKERSRLVSALRILPGVETFSGAANFILIKLTTVDAPTVIRKLGERGMLVRDCSSFPGLDKSYIRIAVRTASENKRLIKAFRELLVQ